MAKYVPILRWKRGEKVALKHLTATARAGIAPLFTIAPDQYVGKKATKTIAAAPAPDVFASELLDSWGPGQFYLDASLFGTTSGKHPLVEIADSARTKGLQLIPCIDLSPSPTYLAAVRSVDGDDGRGVALRVDMAEFASASAWAPSFPFPLGQIDLLLDCADSINAVASLGAAVNSAFTDLHKGPSWRSVTLCGTSMPENFSGYKPGLYSIKRVELEVWKKLQTLGLPYKLGFGDYATIAVVPPPSGIRWGYPINVKYTLKEEFFICRGVATTGVAAVDAEDQLRSHAQTIVSHAHRGRIACWADDRVDAIAAGTEPPQSLEHWVRISVNRHLELTRHHLP